MKLLNEIKTFLLLAAMTGVLLSVGFFFGGYGGALVALIFAGAVNFASYWYSDSIVLRMYDAEEITEDENPQLHETVSELSEKAGIPAPDIYMVEEDVPNAFATGRNPKNSALAVTSGLLERLNSKEREGVISHEITHIKNRDTLVQCVSATVAGAVTWMAHMLSFALLGGRNERAAGSVLFMIFAPLAALLIRSAISRSREYGADAGGGRLTGEPMNLASALKKISRLNKGGNMKASETTSHLFIYNPIQGRDIARFFSTHPPVGDRVERLRELDRKMEG